MLIDGVPPTARIDTRLTVPDWPAAPDEALKQAVVGVTTFELANDAPAVVEDGAARHLVWHGYLTGGLLTLYERLGALLSSHGLGAFYADPRLEVFVPADGEVVVLGALRYPVRLDRHEWDARVAAADSVDDLAATFIHAALAGAGQVVEEARRAAEDDPHPLVARRPELIEQLAPGEVDYELLDDSDFELTEQYDPEGSLDESWVSCHVLRWRTDFVPPGTVRAPEQLLEQAQGWRVSQWEWVPEDADEDDEDDVVVGEWQLRGYAPMPAAVAAEHLPEALQHWVRRMTREAISLFEAVAEEDQAFADAPARLRKELAGLG